jgi:hypothetical protein
VKAVRFTKAEVEVIRWALADWRKLDNCAKAAASALVKLDKAEEATPAGVNAGPLQAALEATSRGKVVPLAGPGGWARASKQAAAVGATVEDAKLVGAWMARQGWLHGPQTLLDVLNKWPQWLAKARATQPPPSAPPGIGDGVARQEDAKSSEGTVRPGGGAPGRLRPGF